MTDIVVDRLRIRGGDARRLATIAARTLPAALDDALADLDDGALGPLSVTLDLDPADYDDATLALLWADRIRTVALAAGARRRATAGPGVGPADDAARSGPGVGSGRHARGLRAADAGAFGVEALVVETLAATASGWLEAGAPVGAMPVALAALAADAVAVAVAARLGPTSAARLVRALERRATWIRHPVHDADAEPTRPRSGPADATADDRSSTDRAEPERPNAPDAPPGDEPARRLAVAARALRPHLDLAAADDGAASSADLRQATRVAGVVLLYPWLADLCRDAQAVHPNAEPVHARRLTLAVLADGADLDPALLDDPLVLFLAGAPDDAPPSSALAPLEVEPLAAAADAVLAGFAAQLRGFQRSSPSFVRASWVVRAGLLDTDTDPARLLGQTLPLDVVLHLLPYPVSLLRLPWTPPLIVRFVP